MPISTSRLLTSLAVLLTAMAALPRHLDADDDARVTPLVRAVASARPSVVNIRGCKTVPEDPAAAGLGAQQMKQVNGMGTGIVIDPRGYILTNYHVVQDVTQIRVTTFNRETVTGQLVARDERTDLALMKIETREPLPVIPLGSSAGVMLAESVAAIGNAYGYEHTVTVGIVSELGRTVQVSDDQVYYDLIQTDAAINPGNSGGPLLNLHGEMIGINVAVRVGAQGIAFAIPINDAIEVAAQLLKEVSERDSRLGLSVATRYEGDVAWVEVTAVEPDSAAARSGLQVGDRVTRIDQQVCLRALDVYRALVHHQPGDELNIRFQRESDEMSAPVALDRPVERSNAAPTTQVAWQALGIEVVPLDRDAMRRINPGYGGGLRIVQVRSNSPAERENIRVGDVLVAMADWKTESIENLEYILSNPDVRSRKYFKFYIFRNTEPLFGQIRVAQVPDR